jgi:flotillin
MVLYYIAEPNEYLVVTGPGVKDLKVVKKWWKLPFQKLSRFSLTPKSYSVDLNAMTIEKLECFTS